MTTKISTVANLAYQVFLHATHSTGVPQQRLSTLVELLNSLSSRDVGFDPQWVTDNNKYHAPVVYVHIAENHVFSMGIFVLKPGSRIPLHDHPHMYGIGRVIYGTLRCRSYTRLEEDPPAELQKGLRRWQWKDIITARPFQDTIMTSESECCVLTPNEGNYHEIQAIEGGAAFVDVLAPPYDHDLGTRVCHFYEEVTLNRHDGSGRVYLSEIPAPKDYYCNAAEYTGPQV